MDVRLVVDRGQSKQIYHLRAEETIIGRRRECNLRIPSAQVSRRQCLLIFQDGFLTLEDLDSTNGTILNGTKVKGKHLVRPGDLFEVGPVKFKADYELTEEAEEKLKAADIQSVERSAAADHDDDDEEINILLEDEQEDSTVLASDDSEDVTEQSDADGDDVVIEIDDDDALDASEGDGLRDIISNMDEKKK